MTGEFFSGTYTRFIDNQRRLTVPVNILYQMPRSSRGQIAICRSKRKHAAYCLASWDETNPYTESLINSGTDIGDLSQAMFEEPHLESLASMYLCRISERSRVTLPEEIYEHLGYPYQVAISGVGSAFYIINKD